MPDVTEQNVRFYICFLLPLGNIKLRASNATLGTNDNRDFDERRTRARVCVLPLGPLSSRGGARTCGTRSVADRLI